MSEIDKSVKLIFNEFQRSIAEVPLEVYYQTLTSDQMNQAGFQFNIKSPGTQALLDTDIWIEYNLYVVETQPYAIRGMFEQSQTAAPNQAGLPNNTNHFSLRSGYAVNRCITNFSLQLNNQTLNVRPNFYMDVLNRLYISNDQSEHEFSTSGGRFDDGNHGRRRKGTVNFNPISSNVANLTNLNSYSQQLGNLQADLMKHDDQAGGNNGRFYAYNFTETPWQLAETARGLTDADRYNLYLWPAYPSYYEFCNQGYDNRVGKLAYKLREGLDNLDSGGVADSNAANGDMFRGRPQQNAVANQLVWTLKLYERLPISLFKMYSNDEVFGVIPNILQMQLQGNFTSNMAACLFSGSQADLDIAMYWDETQASDCKLYLRWYTPPTSMSIPREIAIPYKKIVTWSKSFAISQMSAAAAAGEYYVDNNDIGEYNIQLEAIPDLLLIYCRYQSGVYTHDTPDDYNLEIRNLSINIDNASGKLNQVQSLDLYNKWKRLLKHSDNKIINYEEWRRYCCVAALQPEDYGVRYGPGYSNPTVLGVKFTPRNWHVNPSINVAGAASVEPLGGDAGQGTSMELVVTSIYYKNKLIIRADGSASQEMVKVAADFEMYKPQSGMGLYGQMNA